MTSGFLRNKLPYLLVDLRVSGAKHFSHLLLVMLSWTKRKVLPYMQLDHLATIILDEQIPKPPTLAQISSGQISRALCCQSISNG